MSNYPDTLSNKIKNKNYDLINIPEDKKMSDYNVDERRNYLYRCWIRDGNLQNINKLELADEFDISREMLYQDIHYLRLWLRNHLGSDYEVDMGMKLKSIIQKLMEKEQEKDAGNMILKYQKFLQQSGRVKKQPDEIVVDNKANEDTDIQFRTIDVHGGVKDDDGDGD